MDQSCGWMGEGSFAGEPASGISVSGIVTGIS
jgi:hypothetical protein